jgi:hypothetical protein
MQKYQLSGKRDCLIISVERYDLGESRTNAKKDAEILKLTFEKLKFKCKDGIILK